MSVARSAAEVLRDHVVLEVEAIDRMYLNVYVPHLQSVGAVVGYLRVHRGQRFASTAVVDSPAMTPKRIYKKGPAHRRALSLDAERQSFSLAG
jgi:hypothetical protein